MEEVWNDINLSTLQQYNDNITSSTHNHHNHRQTFHFQDFFSSKAGTTTIDDASLAGDHAISNKRLSYFASTTLSLNTPELDHDRFELGFGSPKNHSGSTHNHNNNNTSDVSNNDQHNNKKKRVRETCVTIETSDQRHKRLMKSRESADRSRARKQAYTNGLEIEVAVLRKENAKLRNQLAQFYLAATPVVVPKKPSFSRPLTAPF